MEQNFKWKENKAQYQTGESLYMTQGIPEEKEEIGVVNEKESW